MISQLAFAVAIVVTVAALTAAAAGRGPRAVFIALAAGLALAAAAAWVAFALELDTPLGVAAGGLSLCAVVQLAALSLREAILRQRRFDETLDEAEAHLREVVERETRQRADELERTLARARAESMSALLEEERRIGEERRKAVAESEREASHELANALAAVRLGVQERLASWSEDLDRAQQSLAGRVAALERRVELLGRGAVAVALPHEGDPTGAGRSWPTRGGRTNKCRRGPRRSRGRCGSG